MSVSVIIPCYNEEDAVGSVIDSIPQNMGEVIVVDNNSTDRSGEVAIQHGARVIVEKQQGYGAAIRRGIQEANGEIVVVLDADGQYPAERITEVIAHLKKERLDFVSCSRFPLDDKKSLPFIRRFGNSLFTLFTNLLFGTQLLDSQSGMWVFKRKIVDKIKLSSFDMAFSQELKLRLLKDPQVTFCEYHIPYRERIGDSKLVPLKHGINNLLSLLKLRLELWRTNSEEKKHFFFGVAVVLILAFYTTISFQHINDPFIHISADVNGQNALAAENLVKHGFINMKFGIYGRLLDDPIQARGSFYTHHPSFYLLPTAIIYKLFGLSEATTRLGPLLCMVIALCVFTFALRKLSKTYLFPLLVLTVFCMLPGVIFYGQTFELALFSVPASLLTFSLYVFYYRTQLSFYKWCLYLSIIIGGLVGWFYYFFAAALWLYVRFSDENKKMKDRKQILNLVPVLLGLLFAFNLAHFFILNGNVDLRSIFLIRTARIPIGPWLSKISSLVLLHVNEVFVVTTVMGIILGYFRRKIDLYMRPPRMFVAMALGIATVFTQWMGHPFGVIFTWTVVALYSGYFLSYCIKHFKKIGLIFVICFLTFGTYMSTKKLDIFYNKLRILSVSDIESMKSKSGTVNNEDVCILSNKSGLAYSSIAEWYLRKKVIESVDCSKTQAKIVMGFGRN